MQIFQFSYHFPSRFTQCSPNENFCIRISSFRGLCNLGFKPRIPNLQRPNEAVEEQWFQKNSKLLEQFQKSSQHPRSNGVHIIFLEGSSGAGKKEILNRLQKTGFCTYSDPFGKYLQDEKKSPPSHKWEEKMYKYLDSISLQKQGPPMKNKIVFLGRSPLSSLIYSNPTTNLELAKFKNLIAEIKERFSASFLFCKTEPMIILQRIHGRFELSTDEQKELAKQRKENDEDYIHQILQKYDYLLQQDLFDAVLDTTSTKQAAAALLRMLDLGFKFQIPSDTEK